MQCTLILLDELLEMADSAARKQQEEALCNSKPQPVQKTRLFLKPITLLTWPRQEFHTEYASNIWPDLSRILIYLKP